MSRIKKVIIPVAGLGTRFLPVTKAQPKEMLPIVDKPVVQYLVEEAVASGVSEVIFVTGRGKRAIEDHFDYAPELELALQEKGKTEVLKEIHGLSKMAKFAYVRQNEPKGDGDAILRALHLLDDEPVAVLFGDVVVDSDPPCLKQLMDVFDEYGKTVVALERVPQSEVHKYGVAEVERLNNERLVKIKNFVEKPKAEEAPSDMVATGKYIITPEVLRALEKAESQDSRELRLADALRDVCRNGDIYGYLFQGTRYDCGSKLGFLKATVDFGLKHKETSKEFAEYLRKRVKGF